MVAARSKEGRLRKKPEPEKRRVRKAQGTLNTRLLNVTRWRCSCGITHGELGRRPGAAAGSRAAEHAARGRQPQPQRTGRGWGGNRGKEWPRPAARAPPRLLPGGPRQGRGREVGAEPRGADGKGAGGAGPNHMAQTAQAARHLFLSLSRTSAPIPPHRRPLPGPIPGPTRGETSSA